MVTRLNDVCPRTRNETESRMPSSLRGKKNISQLQHVLNDGVTVSIKAFSTASNGSQRNHKLCLLQRLCSLPTPCQPNSRLLLSQGFRLAAHHGLHALPKCLQFCDILGNSAKVYKMFAIAAKMFVGRERFSTIIIWI
uniref:uncharacterized protein LOC122600229 isoform X3 n=1 Tax=Erigeron canadensis TaxID=72917 RepID=UPI001CB93271|nr:uncharacterized protein LOC122600229 isoform X3 [Erigeron canadensis]